MQHHHRNQARNWGKRLSPAPFNVTASGAQPLWAGWGGRGGCPEQGQPRSSSVPLGRSPTRPPGCVFSHGQISSPALWKHPQDGAVVLPGPAQPQQTPNTFFPCHLALHSPSRHPQAPNAFFPCHLHIPSVEGGDNQPGMRPQSPLSLAPIAQIETHPHSGVNSVRGKAAATLTPAREFVRKTLLILHSAPFPSQGEAEGESWVWQRGWLLKGVFAFKVVPPFSHQSPIL